MNVFIFLTIYIVGVRSADEPTTLASEFYGGAPQSRNAFNPRLDYDEWTPLGRGDPLKNDPTYDYVPPVLDRVHYWMDPSKRTPDPPLPDSESSSTSTESQTTPLPATSRLGTMSLLDPLFKFMESSKASLGFSTPTSNYYRPTSVPSHYSQHSQVLPHYNSPHSLNSVDYVPPPPQMQALQRPPYTILMPPPPPQSASTPSPITSFGTSTRTTSKAEELMSSISSTTPSTNETATTSSVTAHTTIIGDSENLYKPVAITMPESISNDSSEVDRTTPIYLELKQIPVSPLTENYNHLPYQESKSSIYKIKSHGKNNEDYFFLPTTVRTTTTTSTSRTLTTDPMFKHYKQPAEPARGPFYLIIQGHSKVKTYGASKNKVKPPASNEINFGDGIKRKNYDDLEMSESRRHQRKLGIGGMGEILAKESEEVVQGHTTLELSAKYQSEEKTGFSVSEDDTWMEDLEEAFPKSLGGRSKKRTLVYPPDLPVERNKRSVGRRLLAAVSSSNSPDKLDAQQLGLESLIALNDDYNSDDIINLLLKEEGEGSGVGNYVSSLLLSRSIKSREEI